MTRALGSTLTQLGSIKKIYAADIACISCVLSEKKNISATVFYLFSNYTSIWRFSCSEIYQILYLRVSVVKSLPL